MKAEEALLNVNLAQAWAKGGGFAIGGTLIYAGQTSDTLAQLGSEAVVTGREARLYAGNLATAISWAGGIASGESVHARRDFADHVHITRDPGSSAHPDVKRVPRRVGNNVMDPHRDDVRGETVGEGT